MNCRSLCFFGIVFVHIFLVSCETNMLTDMELLVPMTVEHNSQLPSISINGTRLHSEAIGDPTNSMLVVVHGGPGADYRSLYNFRDLSDHGLYVVFYDQRGSGLSQRHDEAHYEHKTVQFFIDDLEAVIEHYRTSSTQRIILAGHSWGAMLATGYINQYPNKIAGAILAEPGGFTWEDTEQYISRAFELKPFTESTNDAVYVDQFITGDDHKTLDYRMGLFSSSSTTGDIAPPPFWRYGAILSNWARTYAPEHPDQMNFTSNLHMYKSKVLFAYSELNTHYGKEHAELVSNAYPNIQLEQIAGCGHEIVHFGWENFYPLVVDYIDETIR